MIEIPEGLEYIITSTCNIACPDCDRFCNYDLPYFIKPKEFEEDLIRLTRFIRPGGSFTLQGGEPLSHPNLKELLIIARDILGEAVPINIYTNATLLSKKRNQTLIETLLKIKNTRITTAMHFTEKEIRSKLFKDIKAFIFKDYPWQRLDKNTFVYDSVLLQMNDYTVATSFWIPFNNIVDNKIKPYKDNNPELSYERCGAKRCSAIYKGKLYKCPRSALLGDFLAKYKLSNDEDWALYNNYKGINYDDTISVQKFVNTKIAKQSEYICGMCPAYELSRPQRGVKFK